MITDAEASNPGPIVQNEDDAAVERTATDESQSRERRGRAALIEAPRVARSVIEAPVAAENALYCDKGI